VQESIAELTPWMPWCHPAYRQEETANWIERSIAAWEARTEFNFVIVASEGTILGTCGLNRIDHPDGTANLGYWVRMSAAGQGVATRAAELLRTWAFENTSLHRLEIMASAENIGSQRVAEKLGACREGVLRQRMILRGRKHDAVLYSMLRVDDQAAEMVLQN
jgi:RimJ/RimL family protein N-acetyltransferase